MTATQLSTILLGIRYCSSMADMLLTVEKHIVCCRLGWLRSETQVLPVVRRREKPRLQVEEE